MLSVLYTLLLVMALLGSCLVMFGLPGLFIFALVGLLAVFLNWFKSIFEALLSYALILLLIALLLPAICFISEAARCIQCRNHLKHLGLALQKYNDSYKCFPPAYVADKNGKPIHSWRVLILPFIEGDDISKQYDFNEPWDGSNNKKLLAQRPRGFACASDKKKYSDDETLTSYFAVVGPDTIWSGKKSAAGQSVMLVEVLGAGIHWTEPRDYVVPSAQATDPRSSPLVISSNHKIDNGYFFHDMPAAHVAFSDGSVWLLPVDGLADEILLHGVDNWDDDAVDRWLSEHRRIHWPHCIALTIWIVSLVLLLHWSVRCRKDVSKRATEDAEG